MPNNSSWTPSEIDALLNLVIKKGKKWVVIAAELNKTPKQCSNKYRYLQMSAPWTEEEEMKFKVLMNDPKRPTENLYGWISKQIGTKSKSDCWFKARFYSSAPRRKWTFEEKIALINGDSHLLARSQRAVERKRRKIQLSNQDPCSSDVYKLDDSVYELILPDSLMEEFIERHQRGETMLHISESMDLPMKLVRSYYNKISHRLPIPSEEALLYFLELYKTQGRNLSYISKKMCEQYETNDFTYDWCYRTFEYLCT